MTDADEIFVPFGLNPDSRKEELRIPDEFIRKIPILGKCVSHKAPADDDDSESESSSDDNAIYVVSL